MMFCAFNIGEMCGRSRKKLPGHAWYVAHKVLMAPHCLAWRETATMLLFCFLFVLLFGFLGRE